MQLKSGLRSPAVVVRGSRQLKKAEAFQKLQAEIGELTNQGQYEQTISKTLQGLAIARDLGLSAVLPLMTNNLAGAHLAVGQLDHALKFATEVSKHDEPWWQAVGLS